MATTLRTEPTAVQCPVCQGAMWDNRATKKNPRQPDYRCKDRNCTGVIWPPRNAQAAPAAPAKQAFSAGPRIPQMDEGPAAMPSQLDYLFALYGVCLSEAIQQSQKLNEADFGCTPETIAAMTSTLFIQAAKL